LTSAAEKAAGQASRRIQALGELFFPLGADEQRIARSLYRLLASGKAVECNSVSRQSGVAMERVVAVIGGWPGVFMNGDGAITGFWGLAIEPVSTHHFIVDGKTLYAWCAWDTLFMPAHIGKTCEVHASCKQTGEPIVLRVSPEGIEYVSPGTVHLSFVLPEKGAIDKGVVSGFCHFIHFFRDRPAADAWIKGKAGCFVLDLDEANAAARRKIAFEFRQLADMTARGTRYRP